MLHAVASLLDDDHTARLNALWDEMTDRFKLPGRYVRPWAHISWHVAKDYDLDAIEPVLADLAGSIAPFTALTTGLGVFTGSTPILMIPFVRDDTLNDVHRMVWNRVDRDDLVTGMHDLYTAARWMPHLSIAMGEADAAKTGEVLGYLAERDFLWKIPIDNLVLIYNPGTGHEVRLTFPLTG